MKIDIHDLTNKSEVTFKGEQAVSLLGLNLSSNAKSCLVSITGTVAKKGNRYLVRGNIASTIKLLCDRCTSEFEYPIHAELYKEFSTDFIKEDEDIIHVTKSNIDLSDVIAEAVYLSVPMKCLCREDCKGMCNVCGINANEHTCNCQDADIDPRLEKLKNIFRPQSEE
ncbi:YceD family protein [Cellulosilyticum sp. I15G10I2]|uniref:YceD family protein n=1 Tax=Cellulosilyticum sp. I15G10I2 TaxID=1892843 RepID=UPI00085C24EC|nr:DUF177 domain-containing protein [Cellulosilyticum sp. I15G10I2]